MCTSLKAIINPTVRKFFSDTVPVSINGEYHFFNSIYDVETYYRSHHSDENKQKETYNLCNNIYLITRGFNIPFFIMSKCGKCDACIAEKRRNLASRAILEASERPYVIFYTLTYNNESLPAEGLSRKDIALFHKRFRENLALWYSRKYDVSLESARERTNYRTYYCGEYGTALNRTRRAHYHGLFFFEHPFYTAVNVLSEVEEIFHKSWPQCSWHLLGNDSAKCFQIAKSPLAASRYITKYITKQSLSYVPKGKTPLFQQGPVKGGGLGCSNVFRYINEIYNSVDGTIFVRVKDSVTRIGIPKALIDKAFPRFSRDFPKYQSLLNKYMYLLNMYYKSDISSSDYFDYSFLENEIFIVTKRREYLFRSINSLDPTVDSDFKSYSDKLFKESPHEFCRLIFSIGYDVCKLPDEETFITKYMKGFQVLSHYKRPKETYEEYHARVHGRGEYDVYFCRTRMCNDDNLPF